MPCQHSTKGPTYQVYIQPTIEATIVPMTVVSMYYADMVLILY